MQTRSDTKPLAPAVVAMPRKPLLGRLFDSDNPWSVNAGRIVVLILLVGAWELGAGPLFDPFYFGKPSLIAAQFAQEFVDPAFYNALAVTGLQLVLGYVIGAAAGLGPRTLPDWARDVRWTLR